MNHDFVQPMTIVPLSEADENVPMGAIALFSEAGVGVTPNVFAPVVTATAIGTAAKTTTAPEPAANSIVPIKFTNGNSANTPTVAFAGGSARAIQLAGVASTGAKLTVAANGVALFWFDGTILHQLGTYA